MGAGHDHGPGVAEAGQPGDYRRKLWIAFGITATIVVAQAVGSVVTGSLALLTDTAHAITDASGLLVALIAATLMLRPATSTRTWGFRRIEVIAALGQATKPRPEAELAQHAARLLGAGSLASPPHALAEALARAAVSVLGLKPMTAAPYVSSAGITPVRVAAPAPVQPAAGWLARLKALFGKS